MLDQLTNASALTALGATALLAVSLYVCIRLRRIERQTQFQVGGINSIVQRSSALPIAPPAPTPEPIPAYIRQVDAQFEAVTIIGIRRVQQPTQKWPFPKS